MANEYKDKIERLYQEMPENRMSTEKQRQIWAGISDKLPETRSQNQKKHLRFPKGLMVGMATVILVIVIFVPVILQSSSWTSGSSLQEFINQSSSPYLENVETILAKRKVKGGVLIFYQRTNSENERSALSTRYIKKTIWGGWKVTKYGGGYGSGIKQPLYIAYGPGNGPFPRFYGEIKEPAIRSIEVLNQNGKKNDSVSIFPADHRKKRFWYAFIDPAKGPKYTIIGLGKDRQPITTMHYNLDSNSSNMTVKALDPTGAVKKVIVRHPEFPKKPNETITVTKPTGGIEGNSVNVDLTTTVSKKDAQTFIVTFTKDWHLSVNGTYVKSVWKYLVTPYEVKTVKKQNRDGLVAEMK